MCESHGHSGSDDVPRTHHVLWCVNETHSVVGLSTNHKLPFMGSDLNALLLVDYIIPDGEQPNLNIRAEYVDSFSGIFFNISHIRIVFVY